MMKVTATVIKDKDGSYSCYVPQQFDNFGLAGYGDTAQEAIDDMLAAYEETKELVENVPELEFEFKYDIQSFFNYFSFLNISAVADMAGINASLMRQYSAGIATAGEKQYVKIRRAVGTIRERFDRATL